MPAPYEAEALEALALTIIKEPKENLNWKVMQRNVVNWIVSCKNNFKAVGIAANAWNLVWQAMPVTEPSSQGSVDMQF